MEEEEISIQEYNELIRDIWNAEIAVEKDDLVQYLYKTKTLPSPSGKAMDLHSIMRWFDPSRKYGPLAQRLEATRLGRV